MATSISDLLAVLDHASARRTHAADDATRALERSAHLLIRLRDDGIVALAVREDTTRRLADACAEAALTFDAGPGRIGDLVGDAVGRLRADLTDEDRWTVAITLASTTRRCAGTIAHSGPYLQVPQLLEVADRSRELLRAATNSPADPERLIGQDLLIPTNLLPRDASPARVAAESMAALVTRFRSAGQEPMSVRALLGACYAGESAAYAGTIVAGSRVLGPRPEAAQAWQRLRAELSRFTDRPRRGTEPAEPALRCALRVHDSLQRALSQLPSRRTDGARALTVDAELIRRTALLLPALAGGISQQLHRPTAWIVTGGPRPLHEGRVAEWLQRKPFVARADDLYPSIGALHRATQETSRLTAVLKAPGRQAASGGLRARSYESLWAER